MNIEWMIIQNEKKNSEYSDLKRYNLKIISILFKKKEIF
jgi:hypothetical protein